MLDRNFLAKGRAYAVFFLVYTGLFWLFTATLRYTFPFLAGFALAWFLQPVVRFLKQKLPLSEGCAAAVTTAALYVLLIGALFLLGMVAGGRNQQFAPHHPGCGPWPSDRAFEPPFPTGGGVPQPY